MNTYLKERQDVYGKNNFISIYIFNYKKNCN